MSTYLPGATFTDVVTYLDGTDTPYDPTSVSASILFPDLTTTQLATITRVTTGEYTVSWPIPTNATPGTYIARYYGTTAGVTGESETTFTVQGAALDTTGLIPEALTTISAVRDGFSTTVSDAEIARKINQISQRFADRTGRNFSWFTYGPDNPEYVQAQGKWYLYLGRRPITNVSDVKLGAFTYGTGGSASFVGWDITDYQRNTQFDEQGKLYRIAGWVMVVPEWDRLTGDPDTRRTSQQFTVQVQYSGGYILPPYSGIVDSVYNPTGAPSNWPFEDIAIREVRNLIRKPYAGMIEQRTAGGWSQRFSDRIRAPKEFELETEEWLDSQCKPGALFR